MLRIEMIKRGLSMRDLARMTGFSLEGLSTAFSARFPCHRSRARVEKAIGLPLWSSSEEFSVRRRCEAFLGLDPDLASAPALLIAAMRVGIDMTNHRRPRSAVLRRIEEFLAANLTRTKPTIP